MKLGLDSFRAMACMPDLPVKVEVVEIKVVRPSKEIWEAEPKKRKIIADNLVNDALNTLKSFSANDMAEETNLTVACARDKLNALFIAEKVTKVKVENDYPGRNVFYFKLVA